MATPAHTAYGFGPGRSRPTNLSDSAGPSLTLSGGLSDLPLVTASETELASIVAKESTFKDDHEHIESISLDAGGANRKISTSQFEALASKTKPKKVKRFLPDPPDVSSTSDFSGLTRRSVAMGSPKDDESASEWSFNKRSIAKLKRRITDMSETATMDYQRARDLEALKAFVEHVSATVDPSMTLYLERTLYAALQQSWMLGLGGVGLMSVGNGTNDAINLGITFIVISMVSAVSALVLHYVRLHQIKSGEPFKFWQTALFTSLLTLCILVVLALEMHFGILYPYLLRTATVSVVNPEELVLVQP
mmetsp:Transcript_14645/g.35324  ORF Transcript_14645/g.35324 Transcript_14645/m.35324 type:complete len:306 (+) Transcript_14645:171-1088(+)